MKKLLPLTLCLLAAAGYTQAELKKPELIDCNAKKAARNAALDSTVGVSGNCDAEKLANDAKDDVKDSVKDVKKDVADSIDNAKENAADALPGEHHKHDEHKLKRD